MRTQDIIRQLFCLESHYTSIWCFRKRTICENTKYCKHWQNGLLFKGMLFLKNESDCGKPETSKWGLGDTNPYANVPPVRLAYRRSYCIPKQSVSCLGWSNGPVPRGCGHLPGSPRPQLHQNAKRCKAKQCKAMQSKEIQNKANQSKAMQGKLN